MKFKSLISAFWLAGILSASSAWANSEGGISADEVLADLEEIEASIEAEPMKHNRRLRGFTCYAYDAGWEEHGAHTASGFIEAIVRARAYYECKRHHGECYVNCRRD